MRDPAGSMMMHRQEYLYDTSLLYRLVFLVFFLFAPPAKKEEITFLLASANKMESSIAHFPRSTAVLHRTHKSGNLSPAQIFLEPG
jgi:hypothetical protein